MPGKKKASYDEYKQYIVPSLIGGGIVWFLTGDFGLGVLVFAAVWIGNWVGNKFLGK